MTWFCAKARLSDFFAIKGSATSHLRVVGSSGSMLQRATRSPRYWFTRFDQQQLGPTLRHGATSLVLIQDLAKRLQGSIRIAEPIGKFQKAIVKILTAEVKAREDARKEEKKESKLSLERFLYEKIFEEGLIGQLDASLLTYVYYVRVTTGKMDWGVTEANEFWNAVEGVNKKGEEQDEKLPIPSISLFKVLCAVILTDSGARNKRFFILEMLRDPAILACFENQAAFAADIGQIIAELEKTNNALDAALVGVGPLTPVEDISSYRGYTGELKDATRISTFVRSRSLRLETSVAEYFGELLGIGKGEAKKMIKKYSTYLNMKPGTDDYGYLRTLNLLVGFPAHLNKMTIAKEFATNITGSLGSHDRSEHLLNFVVKQLKNPRIGVDDIGDLINKRRGAWRTGELTAMAIILDKCWEHIDLGFWTDPKKNDGLKERLLLLEARNEKTKNPSFSQKLINLFTGNRPIPALHYDYERVQAEVLKGLLAVIETGTDTTNQVAYIQGLVNTLGRKAPKAERKRYPHLRAFTISRQIRMSLVARMGERASKGILDDRTIKKKKLQKLRAEKPTAPPTTTKPTATTSTTTPRTTKGPAPA